MPAAGEVVLLAEHLTMSIDILQECVGLLTIY